MMIYKHLSVGSWKLTDLVKEPLGNEFEQYLTTIESDVKQFESRKKELQSEIPVQEFENLLHSIEGIITKVSVISAYAHLKYYANTSSNEAAALVIKMEKLASDITNRLLFFDLWFKKDIDEDNAQRLIEAVPSDYKEFLTHKRLLARHTLAENEEKVISTLEVTGTGALVKIYDKMTSGFEFVMIIKRGKRLVKKMFTNKEKMLSFIRSPRFEEREASYKSFWQIYKKNSGVLGEIYQNIVIQWRDEHISMRGYNSPISVRNISNNLNDATVEVLLAVCRKNSVIFQNYFTEKAKLLGIKKLPRYHLYAPISSKVVDQKKFTYGNAAETILDTLGDFDLCFREFAEKIFNEQHVDSQIIQNKRGGAFCYTVTPKRTPYILLNFDGKTRDVSTMAHEFGHGIHSLAASDKPISVSHASLPLAETASVFAEMLLNDKLAKKMSTRERRLLLAEQIDDLYATIMRQAYFTIFEIDAHHAIAEENATIDKVSEIYLNNLKEQFGSSVNVSLDFQWEWMYIPHFYHSPFYCYAYSFGNLLALSLYQQYKAEGKSFVPRYLNILSSGGSRKPEELLKESGINISNEEFWQQGFDFVAMKIQELRKANN